MQYFLQQLINGLSVGSIYALIAVGYTMVYGVLQLINFAHGDVFMVGAIVALVAARIFGFVSPAGVTESWLAFALVAFCSILVCGLLGFTIERLAYRPLRDKPRINSLITAVGISLLLEFGGQHRAVFGPTPQPFPTQLVPRTLPDWLVRALSLIGIRYENGGFGVGQLYVSLIDVLVLLVTLILMLALTYIVLRTKAGLGLRAVSFRFDTAALMGVNIDRTISFTFVLGSVLAAVAGVLFAVKYPKVEPLMGLLPGIKAFIAAVFGGIGNIAGAVAGAMIIGLVEVMVVGYVENGSQYRDAIAFVLLIAILLIKPSGLFGKHVVEKV